MKSYSAFMEDEAEVRRRRINFVKLILISRGEVRIEVEDLDDGTFVLDLTSACCNNSWLAATDHEYWLCAGCVGKRLYRGSTRPNFYDRHWTPAAAEDWLAFTYPDWSPLELAIAGPVLHDEVRTVLKQG